MRGCLLAWLFLLVAGLAADCARAAQPALDVDMLLAPGPGPAAREVTSGGFDARFQRFDFAVARRTARPFWLRLHAPSADQPPGLATLVARSGRQLDVQVFSPRAGVGVDVPPAASFARFRGAHDVAFALPGGVAPGDTLYVRVAPLPMRGSEELAFYWTTLDRLLGSAAEHARMITLAFGALIAMSLASIIIWFVLSERLMVLYSSLFSLQALYVAYISGQAFEWPILGRAVGLMPHVWNVPAALSGAIACLFVREIADVRRYSSVAYRSFGALAMAFLVLAFANVAQPFGYGWLVAAIGNVMFVGTAAFCVTIAFLAWRRGSRSAGWYLLAWGLLEGFTIATSIVLLLGLGDDADVLLYYGLPLSMVAAAVLVALGVADRLREQRQALTDAERRAQTDPLTGVLNRRSLIERLEADCARAQAQGLPVALLFIDVDHFKRVNDSFGHAAGDACLRSIITPIQAELRQSDVIGRYGGEEFVVILNSAGAASAHPIAERIVRRVAELRVEGYGVPIHLTCSIGVAASDTLGVWGETLVACADAAVYAAKNSGRNRVRLAEPLAA